MRPAVFLALALAAAAPAADTLYPPVRPGTELRFPRDHGAHPLFRTEWWYFTGWLETEAGEALGFQITFFRSRPRTDPANPSAFAPRQILFAHGALSDPVEGRLVHDQRSARAGFGIAEADEADAGLRLIDWSLARRADGTFRARAFGMDLAFAPTQPIMINGKNGYSRKGPRPAQASYYYSLPHLAVAGTVLRGGRRERVTGRAWLDREWSSTLLDPAAAGWDWTGINFDDGGALMAFRVRGRHGGALYAGGTWRRPDGSQSVLAPGDVRFLARRRWRSPATGAAYPVETELLVRLPEGERRFILKPLFDAQELAPGSASGAGSHGMPAYWEGAVATAGGRGYLELTGYAGDLKL
jgi:predicted secreted hydrolase